MKKPLLYHLYIQAGLVYFDNTNPGNDWRFPVNHRDQEMTVPGDYRYQFKALKDVKAFLKRNFPDKTLEEVLAHDYVKVFKEVEL